MPEPTLTLRQSQIESESRESPTRRVGESFFDYEYLREFKAKIGTAQKVV